VLRERLAPDRHITHVRSLVAIFAFLIATTAHAGVVQTLDGKSYSGDLRLASGDQIAITPANGPAVKVALSEILSVQLKEPAPVGIANARWIGHDIGSPPVQGSARFVGQNVIIRGGGSEIGMDKDEGYFVYQQLAGDGQITARIESIGKTSVLAKAGVMIRASLDRSAASAFAMIQANERAAFRFRGRSTAVSTTLGEREADLPAWVRLIRRGNSITGYYSDDGMDWQEMGTAHVPINGVALIGIAVTAHNNNAMCTAAIEKVSIGGLDAIKAGAAGSPLRGIVLRDGSILGGDVRSANDSAIRLVRDGQEISIPPTDVSRIIFVPLNAALTARLANARMGLLLTTGDVVEGECKSIADERVSVSSVLFGLRKFNVDQVAAVIVRDNPPAPAARNFEVRTSDGSVLLVDKLSSASGELIAETSFAGKLKLTQEQILEIRAGGSRFKALTELKASGITGPAGGFAIFNSASARITVRGQVPTQMIRLVAGSAANYKLDGGYRLLALRFAVPDGYLPTSAVRLVVLGDGRELYRSPPTTALDEPLAVGVKLAGAKVLTLRIELDGPEELGSAAVLMEPSVIQ
jgi:regulation of enolase protein 1 (concanavalin A-like superfamily)